MNNRRKVSSDVSDIISPLPGIFYRRPAPDKDVFVQEGDLVDAGQTIGIVEIMKQFTEIQATTAGRVGAFQVEDFGAVSPGDVIVTLATDGLR